MLSASLLCRCAAAAALCGALLVPATARADRVVLKNGRHMEGKATDQRGEGGGVILEVMNEAGAKVATVRLKASEVAEVIPGDAPKPADANTTVSVALKGNEAYGSGRIDGVVAESAGKDAVVLKVPGGEVQVEKGAKVSVSPRDSSREIQAGTPAEDGKIRTTSEITLRNGRKLRGDVIPSGPDEPLKLRVGAVGMVSIPRNQIADDGIQAVEGAITLPEPLPPPPAPQVEPSKEGSPKGELDIEALKKEIRAQVLKELIDSALDARIEQLLHAGAELDLIDEIQDTLSEEEVRELETQAYELTRQRVRNRSRAETHLAAAGTAALPFLRTLARDPNEFTRRAVQRILVDVHDVRGAPIAIGAMNDPDRFVRELAQEALVVLLPPAIPYDVHGSAQEIAAAQEAYRIRWAEVVGAIFGERLASS